MKILYIANARMPTEKAHGVQIIKMCGAFSKNGFDVELVVPRRFNHIKEEPFGYYGVERNFKITKIFSLDLVQFGKIGFLIQSFSFAISSFLYSLLKKVDIVYSRDELPLFLLSFLKKRVVYEAHMPRFNFFNRFVIKKIKKIITISSGLKDFYIDNGIPANKILVAHDGVDLGDFSVHVNKKEIRKKLNLLMDKPVVMYIGRIDKWKGVKTLLEASKLVPDTQVVIIGEGGQLAEFKKKYPNVIFTGPLPYRDLPYNQQAADVLIIPNSGKSIVSRLYTSPLKVFAHMASGVPIVASDLPSLREVLNEKNSLLAEPDNPEALVQGIKIFIRDKHYSKELAHKAKEDVKQYTWDIRASNIIRFASW